MKYRTYKMRLFFRDPEYRMAVLKRLICNVFGHKRAAKWQRHWHYNTRYCKRCGIPYWLYEQDARP